MAVRRAVPKTKHMEETNVNLASLIAVVLFSLISLGHLLRLVFGVDVLVGGITVPRWVSVVGFIIPILLALALRKESRR